MGRDGYYAELRPKPAPVQRRRLDDVMPGPIEQLSLTFHTDMRYVAERQLAYERRHETKVDDGGTISDRTVAAVFLILLGVLAAMLTLGGIIPAAGGTAAVVALLGFACMARGRSMSQEQRKPKPALVLAPRHPVHERYCRQDGCAICTDQYKDMAAWRCTPTWERQYFTSKYRWLLDLQRERDEHLERTRAITNTSSILAHQVIQRILARTEEIEGRITAFMDAFESYRARSITHRTRSLEVRDMRRRWELRQEGFEEEVPYLDAEAHASRFAELERAERDVIEAEAQLAAEQAALDAEAAETPHARFDPDMIVC